MRALSIRASCMCSWPLFVCQPHLQVRTSRGSLTSSPPAPEVPTSSRRVRVARRSRAAPAANEIGALRRFSVQPRRGEPHRSNACRNSAQGSLHLLHGRPTTLAERQVDGFPAKPLSPVPATRPVTPPAMTPAMLHRPPVQAFPIFRFGRHHNLETHMLPACVRRLRSLTENSILHQRVVDLACVLAGEREGFGCEPTLRGEQRVFDDFQDLRALCR